MAPLYKEISASIDPNLNYEIIFIDDGSTDESNSIAQKIISQSNKKRDLVLKCPEHILFYKQLANNFKDYKIIWIHRDPVKVISSSNFNVRSSLLYI